MEEQIHAQEENRPGPRHYQDPSVAREDASPESLGGFVGMFLLSSIPLVNLVMFFVWGFGSHNVNRKNFGRAGLILMAVCIVLGIIFSASIVSWLASVLGSAPGKLY